MTVHFPNEQVAMNVLYRVATQRRRSNREDMTGTIHGWKPIWNASTVHYGDPIETVL